MPNSSIQITVETDPIVKVVCWARTCRFNWNLSCDLKHIFIDEETAKCNQFERRIIKQDEVEHATT